MKYWNRLKISTQIVLISVTLLIALGVALELTSTITTDISFKQDSYRQLEVGGKVLLDEIEIKKKRAKDATA